MSDLYEKIKTKQNGLFVFSVTFVILSLDVYIKLGQFSFFTPMVDQAHFANWILDLKLSSHYLPSGSLFSDYNAFLHQYLIRLYNEPSRLMSSFSISVFYFLSFIFGDDYIGFNRISIIINSLIIVPFLVWIWLFVDVASIAKKLCIYFGTLILFVFNPYVHYFSYLGLHNLGVLSLSIAILAVLYFLKNSDKIYSLKWFLLCLVIPSFVAFYSYWTNIFILPFIILLTFFAMYYKTKNFEYVKLILKYLIVSFVFILPLIFLFVFRSDTIPIYMTYAGEYGGGIVYQLQARTLKFFLDIVELYGYHFVGIILLFCTIFFYKIVVKRANTLDFIIFWEFLGCLVPFFAIDSFTNGAYLRTFLYLYPVLLLLYIYLVDYFFDKVDIKRIAMFLFFMFGVAFIGLKPIVNENMLLKNLPGIFYNYIEPVEQMKKAYESIESMKIPEDKMFFWDYYARDSYRVVCGSKSPSGFPSIYTLSQRAINSAEFNQYVKKRGIDTFSIHNGYILATDPNIDSRALSIALERVFAQKVNVDVILKHPLSSGVLTLFSFEKLQY